MTAQRLGASAAFVCLLTAALATTPPARAAGQAAIAASDAPDTPDDARARPLAPSPEFAQFPRYAGTLGSRRIVLRVGPKSDDPQGVHGEYQYADTGQVILIAGDRNGATLEVEESDDGTHITGNWVGTFAADGTLAGERMDVDDSNPVPFELRPVLPASSAAPADSASRPIGGVGNLVTGD